MELHWQAFNLLLRVIFICASIVPFCHFIFIWDRIQRLNLSVSHPMEEETLQRVYEEQAERAKLSDMQQRHCISNGGFDSATAF